MGICVGAGYLFGNVPIVKDNFSLVALGIVIVSLLPMAFEILSHRRARLGAVARSVVSGFSADPRLHRHADPARDPIVQFPADPEVHHPVDVVGDVDARASAERERAFR